MKTSFYSGIVIPVGISLLCCIFISDILAQNPLTYQPPVNEKATPEAKALLGLLYEYSGKNILSGQHNFIGHASQHSEETLDLTGEYPVVWGSDFGFADTTNDKDGVHYRQELVNEIIKRHEAGNIITLMWHACRPIDEEPCTWKGSVQNNLSKKEWRELVTPGTEIYKNWANQVDEIAGYLQQLQLANIPVLWRPYHEMNGGWFWWGRKEGEDGYKKLWYMLYDRLTNYHELHNLLWVWNPNAPRNLLNDEAFAYDKYFPGIEYVDVLAADVYHNDYKQSHHDELLELGQGKPIALGEVGEVPTAEILQQQPYWVWFMAWSNSNYERNDPKNVVRLYKADKVLSLREWKQR